jgi:hypothetical protein
MVTGIHGGKKNVGSENSEYEGAWSPMLGNDRTDRTDQGFRVTRWPAFRGRGVLVRANRIDKKTWGTRELRHTLSNHDRTDPRAYTRYAVLVVGRLRLAFWRALMKE